MNTLIERAKLRYPELNRIYFNVLLTVEEKNFTHLEWGNNLKIVAVTFYIGNPKEEEMLNELSAVIGLILDKRQNIVKEELKANV